MNTTVVVVTSLNFLLLICAGLVAITVLRALKRETERLAKHSTRSLSELNAEVASLESSFESLAKTVKRIGSRNDIQARREQTKQASLPANFNSMSPAERKAILRSKLAEGSMQAIRDDGAAIKEV